MLPQVKSSSGFFWKSIFQFSLKGKPSSIETGAPPQDGKQKPKVKADPIEAAKQINEAHRHLEQKSFEKAIFHFSRSLQFDPKNISTHLNMGLAYQSLDNHQSATKCFKNYLTAKPNDIKTHKLLANSFFILGDFDSAIKCYHRILEQDSNDAIVFFNLATAYESAAEFISANNSAEKSLTEEQSAKISKHLNNAILLYSKAISISPTFVEAYNNLGGVYLQLDNLSRARYFITEALKLNDSFPKAVFNMSLVHQRSKDEPNSIQLEIACLEKAKLLEPDNGQIYYNLARAYSMTDQQDKAKENLDKSQALLKE